MRRPEVIATFEQFGWPTDGSGAFGWNPPPPADQPAGGS
jgi:hypothetical protein